MGCGRTFTLSSRTLIVMTVRIPAVPRIFEKEDKLFRTKNSCWFLLWSLLSLELRPQPLRQTQIGKLLRNIVCVDDGRQLWPGSECGIRAWDLENMYGAAQEEEDDPEEDTPPFVESASTATTLCLVVDDAQRKVWSGHKDGRIRCWRMDVVNGGSRSVFKEKFSWQAHRRPVLSMIMTSYGDLWSGSKGGAIMIWQWEGIAKARSVTSEERHMAALVLERSFVDLKSKFLLMELAITYSPLI